MFPLSISEILICFRKFFGLPLFLCKGNEKLGNEGDELAKKCLKMAKAVISRLARLRLYVEKARALR